MGDKLFVGNLPFTVTSEKLSELFSPYGEIKEATVIMNKFNGRSKGFGFVTFASEESAAKAVAEMNGKEVEGRQMTVSEAKPFNPDERPKRDFHSGGRGGFGGGRGGGFGGRDRERRPRY